MFLFFFTRFLAYLTIVFFVTTNIQASSLNGTSSLSYQTNHYVLRDTDTVTGLVRFSNGFTLETGTSHGASATLDTCISCSGGFDLRNTNTLKLLGDLTLDSITTLTSGGKIYGYNRALQLKGDLTLAANQILHLGGSLIIDGKGHDIFIDEHAQLMLDENATVTICNARIFNKRNSPGWPSIAITTTLCRLTLDNVELALDSDFYVNNGQVFIHGDVAVTGTSSLVWRSTAPCMIESNSNLYFDVGTTFSYAPSSTNKDLICMTDQSSTLYLNGCSLLATTTGLRFTKGTVIFDNRVTTNSTAENIVNTTTSAYNTDTESSTGAHDCAWSPDGRFVALTNYSSSPATNTLRIYQLQGDSLTQVGSDASTDAHPGTCVWSPDGKYIALTTESGNTLQVFSFNGDTPTLLGSSASTGAGSGPRACGWSPDGKYIAVTSYGTSTIKIFVQTGKTPALVTSMATGTNPNHCAWCPDGRHIAVVNGTSNTLQIFSFKNGTLTLAGTVATNNMPWGCAWSPCGKYVAVVNNSANTLQVFQCTGSTPTLIGSAATTGTGPDMCSWKSDGRYIALVNSGSSTLQIFSFNYSTPTLVGSSLATNSQPYNCNWSSDGEHIAVSNHGGNSIQLFRVNLVQNYETQALSNGITLGNSALGESCDVTTILLSGAQVGINGILNIDAA